jgi:hypothetical protein
LVVLIRSGSHEDALFLLQVLLLHLQPRLLPRDLSLSNMRLKQVMLHTINKTRWCYHFDLGRNPYRFRIIRHTELFVCQNILVKINKVPLKFIITQFSDHNRRCICILLS